MIIKKATSSDSLQIARLFMLAMGSIVYHFINEENSEKGIDFLEHFIQQKANQYSYEHCFVAKEGNEIVGVINCYDGANLYPLRQPILKHIHQNYNANFSIEDETEAGEFYLDVLAVHPKHQGKGVGSKLLQFVIDEFCGIGEQPLGLLVNDENPNAKRLYLALGFKEVGEKSLSGHHMTHLQFKI